MELVSDWQEQHLISAVDACMILGVTTGYLYTMAKRGKIPSIRVGRSVIFSLPVIERYRDEMNRKPDIPAQLQEIASE